MYQEWFELFNKIKEEGKKQCMEGGWESDNKRICIQEQYIL